MDPNNLRGRAVTRAERPQNQTPPSTPASTSFRPESRQQTTDKSNRKKYFIGGAVLAVLLVVAAAAWFFLAGSGEKIQHDRYQAVFLDNGQVFFGDLKNVDGEYLTLENAYYTRNQTASADSENEEQSAPTNNNVALIQVGDEVYGPDSTMSIRADQVLFWQNLREDSKVAQAIANSN